MAKVLLLIFLFLLGGNAEQNYDFTLIKKENPRGNTLLLLGGIQGDEPGGYLAANLIATKYKITKGSVWVVPNLNFRSMIKNSRGDYGDMNRKFKSIKKDDPDYNNIERVKKLITDKRVTMVLHLHDGSGFYNEKYIDALRNPKRWGQSCIIDQESIEQKEFGNLKEIASLVAAEINGYLLDEKHKYSVKNTNTKNGDTEMEKALTYFSILNNKPAFANEASKELGTNERVYYHLLAIESYMKLLGIEFERGFEMNVASISKEVNSNLYLSFYDNKIILDIVNTRKHINYLPVDKKRGLEFGTSNPLLTVVKNGNRYDVHYGSKQLAHIYPEFFEFGDTLKNIRLNIDGKSVESLFGKKLSVKESFEVEPIANHRVNVIGYVGGKSEDSVRLRKKDMKERFSLDRHGNVYRIEVYDNQNRFQGMVLVDFKETSSLMDEKNSVAQNDETDRAG